MTQCYFRRGRPLSVLLGLLLLVACSSPTVYQAASLPGDYGYREQRLGDNRLRISFLANHLNTPETLDNYLLYRAAELTQQLGYDYFVVTVRGMGPVTARSGARIFPSIYGGYGSDGFDMGVGVGIGMANWDYSRPQRAMMDILMQRGQFPAGDRSAYDPRAILRYLAPVVVPTEDTPTADTHN